MASLDPRGLIGRIYVGNHLKMLHTKSINCGPHGFREEDFFKFSHFKSMGANEPWGGASLDTRGLIGRIYVGEHISFGSHGFREEDFLKFFPL